VLTLLSPPRNPPPRAHKFVSSLMAHFALLATASVLSRYVVSESDEIDWSRYHVERLRLHESIPIFFVPDSGRAAVTAAGSIAVRAAGRLGPTVLEPNYRPESKLPKSVPPLAHWSRLAPQEEPDARSNITAGRSEAPSPAPHFSAPPSLSVPNREEKAGTVNVVMPPAGPSPRHNVSIEGSSTLPIKTADSGPARAASFEISAGQPVNILALSEDRSHQPYVEVDRGLQNVSGLGPGEPRGTGRRESVPTGGDIMARPGTPASAARSNEFLKEPAGALESARPPASGLSFRAPAPSDLKRVNHPANGSYDVVVTQAATVHESTARGSDATGTVYTVYLAVGDAKEWLLEFHGVALPRPPQNSVHVMIVDEDSITPPYPISTVIPDKLLADLPGEVVLHGSITAEGRLRNFRVTGAESLASQLILQLLEEWRFRPAMQNLKPVDVDVRMVVPGRS
jgi:hypothetical protein